MEKDRIKKIIIAIEMMIILSVLGIYLYVVFFTNLAIDDFATLVRYRNTPGTNVISKAWNDTVYLWRRWQGTYFGDFVNMFAIAGYCSHGIKAVWIEMIGVIISFFGVVLFLALRIAKRICEKKLDGFVIGLFSGIVFLAMILYDNQAIAHEFYFHTVVSIYTIPLILGLLTIAMSIDVESGKLKTIIAALCAFCAAGGPLNISAFLCGSLLLLLLYKVYCREQWKPTLIIFAAAFAGSLLNALAPGNFVRYARYNDGTKMGVDLDALWQAFKWALDGVIQRNSRLLCGGTIPLLLIVLLISQKHVKKSKIRSVNPVLLGILFFLGEIIVDYTVTYGNGRTVEIRGEFVGVVIAVLFLYAFFMNLMTFISEKIDGSIEYSSFNVCGIAILLCMIVLPLFSVKTRDEFYPFKIINDIQTGELQKFKAGNDLIFERLEDDNGEEDLVIEVWEYTMLDYLQICLIGEDKDYWINTSAADYFNVPSVTVIYK